MESSTSLVEQGIKQFLLDSYFTAEKCFTRAIELTPNFEAYLYRSQCRLKQAKYDDALNDLKEGSKLKEQDTYGVCFRRGLVNFGLGEFLEADTHFKKASKLNKGYNPVLSTWIEKVKCELASKYPTEEIEITLRNWKQDPDTVSITLDNRSQVDSKKLEISIEQRKLTISGDSRTLLAIELSNSIQADKSEFTINSDNQIVFTLTKAVSDFNWQHYDAQRLTVNEAKPRYNAKKDWDKIEREINKEYNEEAKKGDNGMNLFKELYGQSDENTRRAMVKSYQTSGGTVLSMNWDEVSKKDYSGRDRPTAPDGQEWRDYSEN